MPKPSAVDIKERIQSLLSDIAVRSQVAIECFERDPGKVGEECVAIEQAANEIMTYLLNEDEPQLMDDPNGEVVPNKENIR